MLRGKSKAIDTADDIIGLWSITREARLSRESYMIEKRIEAASGCIPIGNGGQVAKLIEAHLGCSGANAKRSKVITLGRAKGITA